MAEVFRLYEHSMHAGHGGPTPHSQLRKKKVLGWEYASCFTLGDLAAQHGYQVLGGVLLGFDVRGQNLTDENHEHINLLRIELANTHNPSSTAYLNSK